jgi:hypothetical protein
MDLIAALVFAGFMVSIIAVLLGGNPRVLLVRESFFTGALGVSCFVSLVLFPRPLMFYFGRYFATGDNPAKIAEYNALWQYPYVRHVQRLITLVWGVTGYPDGSTGNDPRSLWVEPSGQLPEAAPRNEGGQGEIGQVAQHVLELSTAERHDRRTDHDQRQTDGRQRHQDRGDVEQGGQDQPDGAQDLDGSEGLDEAGAEIQDPSRARSLGQFLLRDEQLASARNQERSGQQASDDPQREVHEFAPCAPVSCASETEAHRSATAGNH